jgi:hypothetical protein
MGRKVPGERAKSRLTLETLRALRSETEGQAGACPDRARAIPFTVRAVTGQIPMIRNMRGMVTAAQGMNDGIQAGRA